MEKIFTLSIDKDSEIATVTTARKDINLLEYLEYFDLSGSPQKVEIKQGDFFTCLIQKVLKDIDRRIKIENFLTEQKAKFPILIGWRCEAQGVEMRNILKTMAQAVRIIANFPDIVPMGSQLEGHTQHDIGFSDMENFIQDWEAEDPEDWGEEYQIKEIITIDEKNIKFNGKELSLKA